MKIAVVGVGAMGTLLGAPLIRRGYSVTLIDRSARVTQIRRDGLVVRSTDGETTRTPAESVRDSVAGAGTQDLILLATKAQDLPPIADDIASLCDDATTLVTIQNGLPWWYLLDADGSGRHLESVDPDGRLTAALPASRIVGSVAYPAAQLDDDGTVTHIEGDRFPVGELDGSTRERTLETQRMFEDAGFRSRVIDDIRAELWLKAWGALSINPISALTGATMGAICSDPDGRELVADMMREAQAVAEALGVRFRHTIEKRIEGARAVGEHKTSMLQDLEAGRPLEIGALLGTVIELASETGHDIPKIRAVHACLTLLDRTRHGVST